MRDGDGRVLHIHEEVGALVVGVLRERRLEIRLVVIVARVGHDGAAENGAAEVRDRHARGIDAAGTGSGIVEVPVEVREYGDPNRCRVLRSGRQGCREDEDGE